MRRALFIALILTLATVTAQAQETGDVEHDIASRYVGRTFRNQQPYIGRSLVYERDGSIQGAPVPGCVDLYGLLEVKKVRMDGDAIVVEARRIPPQPLRTAAGRNLPVPNSDVTLRFRSGGSPWTIEDFDLAFENSLKQRGAFSPYPPGATPPPEGTEHRIAYFLNGVPVYHHGNGVARPQETGRNSDPEYTDAARRAHAGGTVLLRFIVNEDGSVSNVESAQPPLGFGLDEQAVRTAQGWRLQPGTFDGHPVKVELRAATDFCLY